MQLFFSLCVSVCLSFWTAERRGDNQCDWRGKSFGFRWNFICFLFVSHSNRNCLRLLLLLLLLCVSSDLYMINYRFHCYSFNCMIMLASFSIRWSRFFYQFRAQFQNSTTTKIKVPFHLRFSAYELLSLLKFLLLYVLMEFMCYMLLTINWCVFFSSGTNFNFFSVDFLTMDLRFSTFHLTFHSMI